MFGVGGKLRAAAIAAKMIGLAAVFVVVRCRGRIHVHIADRIFHRFRYLDLSHDFVLRSSDYRRAG